jgi:putative flippase GtrA
MGEEVPMKADSITTRGALFRWLVIHLLGASYESHRLLWNLLEITFGFIPTNAFTYATNRRWVFVAGKHAPRKEFVLFTAAAAASFAAGQWAAWYLIMFSSVSDFLVKLGVIVISTLVNFVFRKLVVFSN